MHFFKKLLIGSFIISHTLTLSAGPQADINGLNRASIDVPTLVIDIGHVAPGVQFSYSEIPLDTTTQLTEFLQKKQTLNSDVLLSTDSAEAYSAVAQAIQSESDKSDRLFRFIPIGRLASARETMARGWAGYKKNAAETLKYDKLGLSVMTITTAYDSFIWIHSASLDVHQKSAMVMLNVVFMSIFALDRDMWTKMTVPLRHKIMGALDKFSRKGSFGAKGILASQYLANLTYATGFLLLRQSIISMHDLSAAVTSSSFWIHSLQIAGISTLANFAWSELAATINAEQNPIAKNSLKRITDVRNLVMSQMASMGMVLQPDVYGITPIVAIVTSGSIGLFALMRSNQIVTWLEHNRSTQRLFRQQRQFEDMINEAVNFRDGRYCQQLF